MSTQQDIYAIGSETPPHMLNKENYVPWSSLLICYAKSKPNGKLLVKSIRNGPYVRRIIHEPSDPNSVPHVVESTYEQTDDELIDKEAKQMEADDQGIQTILVGLPEDIYVAIDSCETAQEVWLRVEQMMTGSTIRAHEKKAKKGNVVATRAEGNGNGNNGNPIRCYNCRGMGHLVRNCIIKPRRMDAAYIQIYKHRPRVLRLTKLSFMTQMDQPSVEQRGGTVQLHPATVEETRAHYESLFNNLAVEVEKVNLVHLKTSQPQIKQRSSTYALWKARYKKR
nr:hypothetical protein [Tanacetum cinerariifolium]